MAENGIEELRRLKTQAKEMGMAVKGTPKVVDLRQLVEEFKVLKDRAALMGIKYDEPISVDDLRALVNGKIQDSDEKEISKDKMSKAQYAAAKRKEAAKLVRIKITCMNPNKKEWKGEIFTVGNSLFGSFKRFVPYDTIWHVEEMIYKVIKRKKCKIFVSKKDKYNNNIKVPKYVPEFGIEVLPPLSKTELQELARKQALNNSVEVDEIKNF
jgi:hypothetical protein